MRPWVDFRTRYLREPWGDQAIFVRRGIFERLGGYPDVPLAEDWLFVRRLRRAGRIVTVPLPAVTSARRFGRRGPLRGLLTNAAIVAGLHLGVPPRLLKRIY